MAATGTEEKKKKNLSALKRVRQNRKRRLRNKMVKTRVKNAIKKALEAARKGRDLEAAVKEAQAVIDKAAQKGVLHRRAAARKVSRLYRKVSASS